MTVTVEPWMIVILIMCAGYFIGRALEALIKFFIYLDRETRRPLFGPGNKKG